MHPLYQRADRLGGDLIGAAVEVHREKGPGLIGSIYERCLVHGLSLRHHSSTQQQLVRVEHKGMVFDEPLRFDMVVERCLLIEAKPVERLRQFTRRNC